MRRLKQYEDVVDMVRTFAAVRTRETVRGTGRQGGQVPGGLLRVHDTSSACSRVRA